MDYLLIIIVLLLFALFVVQHKFILKRKAKWKQSDINLFKKEWLNLASNNNLKNRVMDADKLFEHFMRKMGWKGTFGEMLKKHGKNFSDLNGLWRAHKLRNSLAHELNRSLSVMEVKRALEAFLRAFADLGLKK